MEKKPLSFYIGQPQTQRLATEKVDETSYLKTGSPSVNFQLAYKLHREKLEESNMPLRFLVGQMIDDVFVLLHHGTVPHPSVLKHYTHLLNTIGLGKHHHGNPF